MDTTSVLYSILALLLLLYLIKSCTASHLWSKHHHGLNLPPGPWKLPVIGSLHHLIGAHRYPHRALREHSRRHGPLMFLKFGEVPVVVASSREAAREVMKTHDAIFSSRPQTTTFKIINREGTDGSANYSKMLTCKFVRTPQRTSTSKQQTMMSM